MEALRYQLSDFTSNPIVGFIFKAAGLAVIDAFAVWFILALVSEGDFLLAIFVGAVTIGINLIFLIDGLYPFRWFTPGLALLIIVVMYPAIFTIYVAFTNYRDGNLLTREQAVRLLERQQYAPEGGASYDFTVFQSESDPTAYALWLIDSDGDAFFARPAEALVPADEADGLGELDEDGVPTGIDGFIRLEPRDYIRNLTTLGELTFGDEDQSVKITGASAAQALRPKYTYDEDSGDLLDNETGVVYTPVEGTFTDPEGGIIRPGYYVPIGLDNFERLFTSEAIRGPFIRVFIWTVFHAAAAVFLQFWFGLGLALILNQEWIPAKKFLRTIILIPYAIPSFIAVLIWRGLLNEQLGLISTTMDDVFGWNPRWFSDPTWAKLGILFIQIWVGFPYMMLINTGALQSIPSDMYEASQVDGANIWQQFWTLTFPLLLVAVGPLLIASFAFNFNNFTVIRLYAEGGPPIPNTTTPAGHTDILISYSYRLAFSSGRGADYAFATAITVVIFIMVSLITVFNFRLTRNLEEISESV